MSALVGVIVVLEHGIDAEPLEQRAPMPAAVVAGPFLIVVEIEWPERGVRGDVIKHKQVRAVLALLQSLPKPTRLFAGHRRGVIRVQQQKRHVVAEVERGKASVGKQPVENRVEKRRTGAW